MVMCRNVVCFGAVVSTLDTTDSVRHCFPFIKMYNRYVSPLRCSNNNGVGNGDGGGLNRNHFPSLRKRQKVRTKQRKEIIWRIRFGFFQQQQQKEWQKKRRNLGLENDFLVMWNDEWGALGCIQDLVATINRPPPLWPELLVSHVAHYSRPDGERMPFWGQARQKLPRHNDNNAAKIEMDRTRNLCSLLSLTSRL